MPRGAYYTDTGRYVHDVVNTAESIRRYAKPHKVIFRIKNLSRGRKAIIAYWGKKVRGRHTHYAINKILWPYKQW